MTDGSLGALVGAGSAVCLLAAVTCCVRVCRPTSVRPDEPRLVVRFPSFLPGAGGGSGGVRASRMSSQAGAKVGLVELPYNAISSATQVGDHAGK